MNPACCWDACLRAVAGTMLSVSFVAPLLMSSDIASFSSLENLSSRSINQKASLTFDLNEIVRGVTSKYVQYSSRL
jgi:hypothetical protein